MEENDRPPRDPAPTANMNCRDAWSDLWRVLDAGVPLVHLNIGECIVTSQDLVVHTALGSCVTATFHHGEAKFSAIFHALLPERTPEEKDPQRCRHADKAIEGIHAHLVRKRVPVDEVEVKLFGGASFRPICPGDPIANMLNVGPRNISIARRTLCAHGFRILAEDVGGQASRKLYFHTLRGTVWLKKMSVRFFDS